MTSKATRDEHRWRNAMLQGLIAMPPFSGGLVEQTGPYEFAERAIGTGDPSYIPTWSDIEGFTEVGTSGTYTPTRSAESNLDSNVTPTAAQYMRVGSTVTVSGRVTGVDPTGAGAASFELSLPVASNLANPEELAGTAFCGAIAGQGAAIIGSAANNTAVFQWIAVDLTSQSWSYSFTYRVI